MNWNLVLCFCVRAGFYLNVSQLIFLSIHTYLFTPHLWSDLLWQLRGDKVRTKFWTTGWLARASGPWSHFGVSRPPTEAAVRPHQGEIVLFSSCQAGVGICLVLMRQPVVLFPASGTRKSRLQTLSFGLAHTSVKLVLPAAVYQHYSQQAQRLQVLHFIYFFHLLSLWKFYM